MLRYRVAMAQGAGFHDHIIRDEPDYQRIYNYILTNPIKWGNDKYYQ